VSLHELFETVYRFTRWIPYRKLLGNSLERKTSRAARSVLKRSTNFLIERARKGAFPCPSSLTPFCFFLDSSRSDGSRSRIAGFLIASQIRFVSVSSVLREKIVECYDKKQDWSKSPGTRFNMFHHVYEIILDSLNRTFYVLTRLMIFHVT